MRIGIDARELCGRATGAGRYLSGLLSAWAVDESARNHSFILYTPEALTVQLDARRFPTRLVSRARGVWWEQVSLPRVAAADHLDVFFAQAYTAPLLLRVPTVVTIHDVSFVAHPEWFTTREGLRRRWLTRLAARNARAIVTVSDFSRRELIERLGVPDARIHVLPSGIGPRSASLSTRQEPRLLYVGSIFNRRHVPDLIRAFGLVSRRHREASLDIVGDNRSYPRENLEATIAAEQIADRVRCRSFVADPELRDLYARARAFAFLSEYEGHGLTPLEAIAAGAPAVVADTPVARETCGGAALYVPVGDVPAAARALEVALFDEPARATLLAAAPAALAKFDWPRAARGTLKVLESVAD